MSVQTDKQVKCKTRVADHGNAILDLVKQETLRIDSRFLEPACGSGNLLVEVLNRKLEVVKSMNTKELLDIYPDYEKYVNKYRMNYTYKPQTLSDFFENVVNLIEKSTLSSNINCIKEIIRELESKNLEYKQIIQNIREISSSSFEYKMR